MQDREYCWERPPAPQPSGNPEWRGRKVMFICLQNESNNGCHSGAACIQHTLWGNLGPSVLYWWVCMYYGKTHVCWDLQIQKNTTHFIKITTICMNFCIWNSLPWPGWPKLVQSLQISETKQGQLWYLDKRPPRKFRQVRETTPEHLLKTSEHLLKTLLGYHWQHFPPPNLKSWRTFKTHICWTHLKWFCVGLWWLRTTM